MSKVDELKEKAEYELYFLLFNDYAHEYATEEKKKKWILIL